MTIVKELNELAKKMTGTNPKARTDAQALDYIEQNFSGGGSGGGSVKTFTLPTTFLLSYFADPTKYGQDIDITDESEIALYEQIRQAFEEDDNQLVKVYLNVNNVTFETFLNKMIWNGEYYGFYATFIYWGKVYTIEMDYFSSNNGYTIIPNVYDISGS